MITRVELREQLDLNKNITPVILPSHSCIIKLDHSHKHQTCHYFSPLKTNKNFFWGYFSSYYPNSLLFSETKVLKRVDCIFHLPLLSFCLLSIQIRLFSHHSSELALVHCVPSDLHVAKSNGQFSVLILLDLWVAFDNNASYYKHFLQLLPGHHTNLVFLSPCWSLIVNLLS